MQYFDTLIYARVGNQLGKPNIPTQVRPDIITSGLGSVIGDCFNNWDQSELEVDLVKSGLDSIKGQAFPENCPLGHEM